MIVSGLNAAAILKNLKEHGNKEKALALQRFFKTAPGQYGEGDVFAGIRVPEIRKLAKQYHMLPISEIAGLLRSPVHEARMLALLILVGAYAKGDSCLQNEIYNFYLRNTRHINNWDLVDVSAEHIVGAHLRFDDRTPIHALATSDLVWDRRISIMATFHYIKRGEFAETLRLAKMLLLDGEDLIHKAVGWMLREIGKRDQNVEELFLRSCYRYMPRTMLRYSIERFPEELRQLYLRGKV
jgi:3-methyladenine DNA glycosylase AlkD